MAGNMWEWTTGHNIKVTNPKEEDPSKRAEQMFVTPRGGGFNDAGGDRPAVRANGNIVLTSYGSDVGFRVVLYVK